MNDKKLEKLFKEGYDHKKTQEELDQEWLQIKKKTIGSRLNPPPENLKYQMGAALILILLFLYTLAPKQSVNEADLGQYLIEDSFPFEEEGISFVDQL